MKVFVINLLRDRAKRKRAIKILSELDIDFEIVDAIDGSQIDVNFLDSLDTSFIEKYRGFKLSNAEVGVYLSHILIYNQICSQKIDYACILEDDFCIKDGFKEIVSNGFINKLNSVYDILMLGHFLSAKSVGIITKSIFKKKFDNFSILEPLEFNYGAHAYIISNKAATELVNNFSIPKCPIDNILGLSELYGLPRLVVSPPIVYQSTEFDSTIQATRYSEKLSFKSKLFRIIKTVILHLSPIYQKYNMKKYKVI
jgi:glycosyl transferase family 25